MEFAQEFCEERETIASIATPAGEGAIAAIRISGKEAIEIAAKIFSRSQKKGKTVFRSHVAMVGHILDQDKNRVDEVVLLPFFSPKSYTGEDSVEIYCHGGSFIAKRVLQQVLQAGARQARGGEFTFRAFMNGKMDLSQAEAVQSLISAKNEKMVAASQVLLEGRLSEKVRSFQNRLFDVVATMEAFLDFPDEDLDAKKCEEIRDELLLVRDALSHLASTYLQGRIVHEGIKVALIGAPNVGKSSLMNFLVQKSRSIVSAKEGTTRDTVEETLRLFGLHILLIDTAGIRYAEDEIEEEGMKRSWEAVKKADLILHVVDSASPQFFFDRLSLDKMVLIWNKRDLVQEEPHLPEIPHQVALSCVKKEGLDRLLEEMEKVIFDKGLATQEALVITEARHKEAIDHALLALNKVLEGLDNGYSLEYLALEVREALYHLGKIIGVNITEEILTTIFNKFCIGK